MPFSMGQWTRIVAIDFGCLAKKAGSEFKDVNSNLIIEFVENGEELCKSDAEIHKEGIFVKI